MNYQKTVNILILLILLLGIGITSKVAYDKYTYQPTERIMIPEELRDVLNKKYNNAETEFLICIYGSKKGDTIKITDYKEAEEIYESTEDKISGKCPINYPATMGTIHNHNDGICKMSNQDIFTFGESNHETMGIICGNNRMFFYTPESLIYGIRIEYY